MIQLPYAISLTSRPERPRCRNSMLRPYLERSTERTIRAPAGVGQQPVDLVHHVGPAAVHRVDQRLAAPVQRAPPAVPVARSGTPPGGSPAPGAPAAPATGRCGRPRPCGRRRRRPPGPVGEAVDVRGRRSARWRTRGTAAAPRPGRAGRPRPSRRAAPPPRRGGTAARRRSRPARSPGCCLSIAIQPPRRRATPRPGRRRTSRRRR